MLMVHKDDSRNGIALYIKCTNIFQSPYLGLHSSWINQGSRWSYPKPMINKTQEIANRGWKINQNRNIPQNHYQQLYCPLYKNPDAPLEWNIYLHLAYFHGKCRYIYHIWIIWDIWKYCLPIKWKVQVISGPPAKYRMIMGSWLR